MKRNPPFRAEHVGSLHRPKELREARMRILGGLAAKGKAGAHGNAELTAIEDGFIRDVVKLQEDVGLRTVTDGEFRRQTWLDDILGSLSGIGFAIRKVESRDPTTAFRSAERAGKSTTEDVENITVEFPVTDRIRWQRSVNVAPFMFLQSATRGAVPKVTMPAPDNFYYFGGRHAIDRGAYPEIGAYWDDMADAYKQEIGALAAAGCVHVQLDDVVPAFLCDAAHIAKLKARGDDPQKLLAAATGCINRAIAGRSEALRVSLHICRGNRHGHFMAEGAYDAIAEHLFGTLEVDNYYLEFDTPRAGSFAPLRFMPEGKTVVLGLVTTKRKELEPKDALKRRIDEAAKYVPLDRLALSPQCGFSGDMMSDVMTVDDQKRKLALVVETATEVWGSV
jgi:5-methyltetrahydropteroyltriglutamate--homocysteine methyltransferase